MWLPFDSTPRSDPERNLPRKHLASSVSAKISPYLCVRCDLCVRLLIFVRFIAAAEICIICVTYRF